MEPGASVIGGGIWQPEPQALKKIRDRIVNDPKTWQSATSPGIRLKMHDWGRAS